MATENSEARTIALALDKKDKNYKLAYLIALKSAAAGADPRVNFKTALQAFDEADEERKKEEK